ncbi:hypothetical protein NA57DRAFT_57241 [Rhizodiscina lignyota]|uniref:RING-type E3 ubiquitin transferase n=1 Tax=Rhizodiscina lignyota TaxID=1504668 RepID=A0A9P4IAM6_9PEZI|nr:hypothetical protein NA57DRAFT_57241 [Rhizodiscina lignyota]
MSTLWTLLSCLAVLATSQSVVPVNGTSSSVPRNQTEQVGLQINRADGLPTPATLVLIPLTDGASDKLPNDGRAGTLFPANVNNVANITFMSIAWISCDPTDYNGNLGAIDVLQRAVENQASAALLYSRTSSYCNYTAGSNINPNFNYIYSLRSRTDSIAINSMVTFNADSVPMRATINLVERLQANNTSGSGSNNGQQSNQQPGGPSPSTAVAMIILYSITGVITALFLIIIITGAIRAHRHPERYGPRAVLGRARQSRAKGLARAMLDSIPIVKFGDGEGDTPKPEDVEMAPSSSSNTNEHAANGEAREEDKHEAITETAERRGSDGGEIERTVSRESEGGIGADVAPPVNPSNSLDQPLGCSICTEDFERGEDVRVLPCNHKFHPACIDPWLLNVSGTCPLCRIDLRPPTSDANDTGNAETTSSDDGSAVPSLPQGQSAESIGSAQPASTPGTNLQPGDASSRRQSRRLSNLLFNPLNRQRMQDATPEERIQALRQYNARNQSGSTNGERESRRRRISARLSDAFSRGMKRTEESSAEASRSATPVPAGATAESVPSTGASTTETPLQPPILSPLSFEERHREEPQGPLPASSDTDQITAAPVIRVQSPEDDKAPAETDVSRKD